MCLQSICTVHCIESFKIRIVNFSFVSSNIPTTPAQALVSFKKYMPPPLPYFKVNMCPLPLRLNIFAYLWSFRWPNYIVTLPRYFSFRLPHLNIPTAPPPPPQTNLGRFAPTVVSKSGNPGPGPVPKTRAQIRIFFITSLLRY